MYADVAANVAFIWFIRGGKGFRKDSFRKENKPEGEALP